MVVDAPFYAQTTTCFAASLSSGQWKCTQTLFRENVTKYRVKRVSEINIEAVALQPWIVSEKCRPEGEGRITLILRVPWAWTCSFNYKFPNTFSHTPKNKTTAFLYTLTFLRKLLYFVLQGIFPRVFSNTLLNMPEISKQGGMCITHCCSLNADLELHCNLLECVSLGNSVQPIDPKWHPQLSNVFSTIRCVAEIL